MAINKVSFGDVLILYIRYMHAMCYVAVYRLWAVIKQGSELPYSAVGVVATNARCPDKR
jgi:hypothetical protein